MTRTLPPVPSIAQFERAGAELKAAVDRIMTEYREAMEITSALETAFGAQGGSTDAADPTAQAVMSQLVNREGADGDRWAASHTLIRSAVNAFASSLYSAGQCASHLTGIIHLDARRGVLPMSIRETPTGFVGKGVSQSFAPGEADRIADEYDAAAERERRHLHGQPNHRVVDPRSWRSKRPKGTSGG